MTGTIATPDHTSSLSSPSVAQKAPEVKATNTIASKPKKSSKGKKSNRKSGECPIFLRKTYLMVDSCDPTIASWSDDGETFIVKDPDGFASKVIPQYFKHNNFASFVRQLNFYGFHKIRYSDSLKIDPKLEAETANFWRFHNPNFKRGRTDLLSEIRRGKGTQDGNEVTPEQQSQEVTSLKKEMLQLREKVASMSNALDQLSGLVQQMNITQQAPMTEVGTKKRKVDSNLVLQTGKGSVNENTMSAMPIDNDVNNVPEFDSELAFNPGNIFPTSQYPNRETSTATMGSAAFIDDLMQAYDNDEIGSLDIDNDASFPSPLQPIVPQPQNDMIGLNFLSPTVASTEQSMKSDGTQPVNDSSKSLDPRLKQKLNESLSLLPTPMQEMLVDKMVSTITDSEVFKTSVEAPADASVGSIMSPLSPKSNTFVDTLSETSPKQEPDTDLQTAMRVLVTYMAKKGAVKNNVISDKIPSCVSVHG